MGETVDVKSLRARFNNNASTSDTSSRDSGSPKSPLPGFGRAILPATENNLAQLRLSPTVLPPRMACPGQMRFPSAESSAASISSRAVSLPQLLTSPAYGQCILPAEPNTIKHAGEMLENMLLRKQRFLGTKLATALGPVQASVPTPSVNPLALQQKPEKRSAADMTPLRRTLHPAGPPPLKPKRPPFVYLEPFLRFNRSSSLPGPKMRDEPGGRKMSLPAVICPPQPPQRFNKPGRLLHQAATVDIEDNQSTYDDIASFDISEYQSNHLQSLEDEDLYDFIDEDQIDLNLSNVENKSVMEIKRQMEQEKQDQVEHQKTENMLRKNFQLNGEVQVLQTARVRQDCHEGGMHDLSVRRGDIVEILRVKNNPAGKWLARSLSGNYGYISNTCVEVDCEALKCISPHSGKADTSPLPLDTRQMEHVETSDVEGIYDDDDDYDDVQPLREDFPPPPPEVSMDPKALKELRKKFKYEGCLLALHTMMVDPNSIIKKPRGKDLHVTQGEVLDVIELTSNKKALCRNQFGKYGYVSRSILLQMEGDIYDDVDYCGDIYDNDSQQTHY